MNLCGCWLIVIDSIHPGVVPIAKTRALVDRSSMIGGGGRHVEGIGNGEDKRTLGDSYMIPWEA